MYISKVTTTIQGMPLHEARNQSRLRRKASSANEPELYIMSQQKKYFQNSENFLALLTKTGCNMPSLNECRQRTLH